MSKNFKKNINPHDNSEKDLRVILFVSRNKDNKNIADFKQRRCAFLAWTNGYEAPQWVLDKFNSFVKHGRYGEFCRMYMSVNARDPMKVKKALIMEMFSQLETFDLQNLESFAASVAAKPEMRRADQKKWLFDYDYDFGTDDLNDSTDYNEFLGNIPVPYEDYLTPHGRAVITDCGFDNREMVKRFSDNAIPKKDDLLLVKWQIS
jgi:hypothetical protein